MPDDSNGVHSLPPGTIVNSGDTILPSQHNPMANDLSSGLTARFSKDGRAPATGTWNLNTFRITNLGAPTANADATTKAYVDSATLDVANSVKFISQTLTPAQQAVARSNISAGLRGYLFGLTLSPNVTDPANDVDISAGETASSETDAVLISLPSSITKRVDSNWVVGTNQGGLDAGSVSASATYYIWLIRRSDTGVVDALFSLSSTSPTMPTSYDQKRLLGVVGRGSSVNGYPNTLVQTGLRYGGTFSLSGLTSFTILGVPSNARRITLVEESHSLSGSANPYIRVGPAAGIVSTGYISTSVSIASVNTVAGATYTTAFGSGSGAAANIVSGKVVLSLENPITNTWVLDATLFIEGVPTVITQAGRITLSGLLDRIQFTTSNGTDIYDSGSIAVYYE